MAPPSAMSRPIPLGTIYEFDSRKGVEQAIMIALRDMEETMIGICGMRGVGKTTMAKRIMSRVLEEHIFDEVVMVVISQQVDKLKIQLKIGESLGLKDFQEETPQARARKLHERLSSGTTRILLVLDDVWRPLNLKELGIPCEGDSEGCAILITSRDSNALRAMNLQKVFRMENLSEEDAWNLFREKVGPCVDDNRLNPTAKEVVRECGGLPLAIVAISVSLQDEKSISVWKDALRQLRNPNPKISSFFMEEVYNPLIVSYYRLDNEEVKSLLLLFCLFPEGVNILVEKLLYFCMGLHIFKDIKSVEEARGRMYTLIENLKTRSFLLDGEKEDCVRMHDVVHDVCIFIAKQEGYVGGGDCTWMSTSPELIQTYWEFPNLKLLYLIRYSEERGEFKMNDTLFQRMRNLEVLSIENYSWTSLPHTTQFLRNLQTLLLVSCPDLKAISVVGDLVNLEILICRDCGSIQELPPEIGRLRRLKLLELSECQQLQRIGLGVISSLDGLEELKMLGSFNQWGSKGRQNNASLRELSALTNLICLEIEIKDPALASEMAHLSSRIKRFDIRIPAGFDIFTRRYNKKMSLHLEGETYLGDWIEKQILSDTECLYLTGNGANKLVLQKNQNLQWLELGECETIKYIVTNADTIFILFSLPNLEFIEYLKLFSLPNLEEIWDYPTSSNSFQNLKQIIIEDLPALKQMWNVDMTKTFPKLELLSLKALPKVKNLFIGFESFEFPLLKVLHLVKLTQLEEIWDGPVSSNSFQNLKQIIIEDLPALKQMWKSSSLHLNYYEVNPRNVDMTKTFKKLELLSLKALPQVKNLFIGFRSFEFPLLKVLHLVKLTQLEEIWDGPVSSNSFQNLKQIIVEDLPALKQMWKSSYASMTKTYPKLEFLSLKALPKVKNLFIVFESFEFPLLKVLHLVKLTQLEEIWDGPISSNSFQNLKQIIIEDLPALKQMWNVDMPKTFPKLELLSLKALPKVKNLFIGFESFKFPLLKVLHLVKLTQLEEIWDDPVSSNSFQNLKKIIIEDLPALKQIWKSSSLHPNNYDEENPRNVDMTKTFPKLEFLSLKALPKVKIGFESFEFPLLKVLHLVNVTQLEEIWDVDGPLIPSDSFKNLNELRLEFLPALKHLWRSSTSPSQINVVAIFNQLASIHIYGCHRLCNLFPLSGTASGSCVLQLKSLVIESCDMMEQVFLWKEESESHYRIRIPNLKVLILDSLPRLTSFCEGTESVEFPPLDRMRISRCPLLETQFSTRGSSYDQDDVDNDSAHLFCKPHQEKMELKVQGIITWGNMIQECVEYMSLQGDGSRISDVEVAQSMRCLVFRECWMKMTTIATVFPLLEVMWLVDIDDIQEICDIDAMKNLKELRLKSLPALKHLNVASNFNQLSCVYIYGCRSLCYLFSLSVMATASSCLFHLERLVIERCDTMEQVFLWNGEEKQMNIDIELIFPKLKFLSLISLPRLTSFCKGKESFEFPLLDHIQLKDCPLLAYVDAINLFNKPGKLNMLLWKSQPFKNAEYLTLEGDAKRNLDFRVARNIRCLSFRECETGTKLVPVTTMDALFPHLEVLRLVKLFKLQEIWDIDDGPIPSSSFKNLKELRLEFLPALNHLWKSSNTPSHVNVVSIFRQLSSIYIYGCHSLRNLFTLPASGSCTLQLEKLVIESCDMMEQVFLCNEGGSPTNIEIPRLKVLILDSLPRLTSLSKGTKSFELPLLDRKRISRCPLLENFVSLYDYDDHGDEDSVHLFCKPYDKEKMKLKLQGNITPGNRIEECVDYMSLGGDDSRILDIGVAEIMRCLTLRKYWINMTTIATVFPLLEVMWLASITDIEEICDIDAVKNLKELRLKSLPALKHLKQISTSTPSHIFNQLSCIYIYGCHSLCYLFSLSVMATGSSCLLHLERLVIEQCDMMEQVFLWDKGEEMNITLVFPKLKFLSLIYLPRLTSFCKGKESFEFPLLSRMRIARCPLLVLGNFVSNDSINLSSKPDKKKVELWINQLFGKVAYMSVEGDVDRNMDWQVAQNMPRLSFKESCSTEINLVNMTAIATAFPFLEVLQLLKLTELVKMEFEVDESMPPNSFEKLRELKLESLQALKYLWQSSSSPSQMKVGRIFNQLSSIYIYECNGLCNLFPLSMIAGGSCLLQLETLEIESCEMMDQVFLWSAELEKQRSIHVGEFPKLKLLRLSFLPRLADFCRGIKRIKCPLLAKVEIVNCHKLRSSVAWNGNHSFIFNRSKSVQHQRAEHTNTAMPGTKEKGKRRLEDSTNEDI